MRKTAIKTAELEIELFLCSFNPDGLDTFRFEYYFPGDEECSVMEGDFAIIESYLIRVFNEDVQRYRWSNIDPGNEDYNPHRIYGISWFDLYQDWLDNDKQTQSLILKHLLKK